MVSPSASSAVGARVAETVHLGSRIAIGRDVDPAAVGEAIHACLAAQLVAIDMPLGAAEVQEILLRMGVKGAVEPAALVQQLNAVRQWLGERWPGTEPLVEVPISHMLKNGQRVSGRIDLMLRSGDGWILFDHKASAQGGTQWEALAEKYGGQLAAYSAAIEAVTGVPVKETWLVLPVAGAGVRVEALAGVSGSMAQGS